MTSDPKRVGLNALHERLHRVLPNVNLTCQPLPQTPSLKLWLLDELFPEKALEPGIVNAIMEEPPYWSFCWASGQVLAEYLIRHPEWVKGRCVVDVGPGSGVVAIAAAMAGARKVIACDLDEDALTATQVNAAENGVHIELSQDLDSALADADLVTAADILYDRENLPLLSRFNAAGAVLLADSRVPDLDPPGYRLLGQWQSCTWPDLGESSEYNGVRLFASEP
ncbi:methyltransferase [Alcanivorax sp. DP30]|uniref:class I SAM-dependent methyltransferase n=1 Tax=Alcanivorax sp. DP30 TaxID=2606217 RepID=UPI0013691C1E|nr:50S ribosomal protein L11 methyltransferase [Alcanivorax sp. DP30]MZR63973.1 methyltransferase [Alcanivorax sp. DP30]